MEISRAALETGANCLAVATVGEGAELRAAGIEAPILLFSQVLPEEIPDIIDLGLSPFVSDGEFIRELAKAAQIAGITLEIHLKIDTGMGRLGCLPPEAAELAALIASSKGLRHAGTATHLARSDSSGGADVEATQKQIALFKEAVESIRAAGFDPGMIHAANSGGAALHDDSLFDLVRPGILLYGYGPALPMAVEPVMELVSRVMLIKKVKKGGAVSYGGIWTAPEDSFIGVLPLGYADGLPRLLSGTDYPVFIRGRPYPLVGRICMDQCMVCLGPDPEVRRWDEAVIFGAAPARTARDLAEMSGTIPYEITCGISKRVPRIYLC
ncbi:alanine racemase [Spirochaetia bacterium]|nr:alanine racemase [Spirochaetia bacterium]